MSQKQPQPRKSLREWIAGLSVWSKIGWTIVLGYIVGRIVYWIYKMVSS
ncbi:hypothetical protein [Brevibacillus brevis]|uniref:Uncharacterized protein n=1 Tax=Brevibacillus brevis TaxID=1393 RepID=A0ABY9T831_BREBE|nr:hypothetical protein [Brevibacillus brevis]WNC16250.1 hypothetical protein RGB73_08010 [Brevibacillus brevis]